MKENPQLRSVFLVLMVFFNGVFAQTDDCKVIIEWKKSLVLSKEYAWTGIDCCNNWEGIGCQDNRVTRIQLKQGIVTGTLTPNLNNLTNLQHLEFNNEVLIGGDLPTLKGLGQLQVVLIHNQNFTSIPVDFFEGLTSLQSVFMDSNPLAPWEIPVSLMSCSNLANFTAESTNLKGKIPAFFNSGNFSSLVELRLGRNMLVGGLPVEFDSFTNLQSLWLNEANLTGRIDVLGKMTGLVEIVLNKNSFTGPIPDLSRLSSLVTFNLRDNQLTGPVPGNLTSLSSLRVVNLTNNLLQGPMPVFGTAVDVDMRNDTNKFCTGKCSDNTNIMLSIVEKWGYPAVFLKGAGDTSETCNWLGVTCPNVNGNITVINFRGKGLTGMIPAEFALLRSLTTLDLSDNALFGPIPKELGTLPLLKKLVLTNNNLSGGVPDLKGIVPVVDGNAHINDTFTGAPPPPGTPAPDEKPNGKSGNDPNGNGKKKSGGRVGLIVSVVIATIVVLLGVLLVICLCKRKNKSGRIPNAMVVHPHNSGSDPDLVKITVAGSNVNVGAASETYSQSSGPSDIQMVEAGNMVISIQVLRNVTNNFSEENVLGRGGFGTVYKGELHDGTMIAVKRMESGVMGTKGLTEFKSEIDVLNKVRHRHLVSLIGYCLDGNERILVYEYMPKGTLSQHLFGWQEEGLKPLEWTRRLSIALDVARGVEYLHGLASQSFIHRDLKPSNILLGDDMKAKVADFGLVRLAPEGKASIETRLAGTFGYLAPEYAATGRVTTKVDVYAFGVILMELITGRKALDESQPEESMHLVTWFRRMTINKDTARKAIDPTIDTNEESLASISTVSELAGYCCSREPHQRPDMGHVVNVLSSLVELWKPSDTDPEDIYAIDMELSLAQTLKKWQAFDGDTSMDRDNSSFLASVDNTQTSIPTRPSGFADSFTSADGR